MEDLYSSKLTVHSEKGIKCIHTLKTIDALNLLVATWVQFHM